ncbi:hypothetical protein MFIFM68171_07677 [Madurella fahalii]|uniref:Myb-like domain-containing protein n=1 Tax=Madurella fahalii TaxID=1157608 RepID=A0ABQ0GI76_9PEZI
METLDPPLTDEERLIVTGNGFTPVQEENMLDFDIEGVDGFPGMYMKGTVLYLDKPPSKDLDDGDVDIDEVPNHVQHKIRALQMAIRAKRPPPPRFARRGPPPRPVPERWRPEEDELLLTLMDHGFPYSQIAYHYLDWRTKPSIEKRARRLNRQREAKRRQFA